MALAQALQSPGDVVAALRAFERVRMPVNRRIMARGRDLGACLEPRLATPADRERAERHHTPAAVMSEIAVLDFLQG